MGARLLSIVDAYVVMTTKSHCKDANRHEWALAELRRSADTQFDRALVEQFARLLPTLQSRSGGLVETTYTRSYAYPQA